MSRMSRGCQQCRTRKVKCDQGRPSCQRCVNRGEACAGYRDEGSLIFRDENDKVGRVLNDRLGFEPSLPDTALTKELCWATRPGDNADVTPRSKSNPSRPPASSEQKKVSQFFDRFVLYPCNDGSSPGFLEHLPGLFKDIDIENRYTLRYAVLAAAHASSIDDAPNHNSKQQAFHYYGLALSSLAKSLDKSMSEPDDYILMTVVVLDIFEVSLERFIHVTDHIVTLSDSVLQPVPNVGVTC